MTRPLCKSSNLSRPAVDDGLKGLLRNISHHIARSRNDDDETGREHHSSSPTTTVSFIEQSSSSYRIISKRGGANDWPLLSRSPRKRSIAFSEKVGIRFTTSLKEMTPQEFAALWYSAEEYNEITQACSKQIARLDRGEILKDKKFCSRGLECHTHIRALAKTMNRSMAYRAVLEEQHRQSREGVVHDDAIARVYHDVSSSCQIWANAVALADQREAERIQEDDNEEQSIATAAAVLRPKTLQTVFS